MAQKVATVRKMKLRQEKTSLGQISTVTAKPTISDKHLLTPTRAVLKFRRVTWDSPLAGPRVCLACFRLQDSCAVVQ